MCEYRRAVAREACRARSGVVAKAKKEEKKKSDRMTKRSVPTGEMKRSESLWRRGLKLR